MWFGELSTENCTGCILAHSLRVGNRRVAKGTVLDESLITELVSAGYRELTVARIDEDDIDENSAAQALAESICGVGLRLDHAHTGRVNIVAANSGLLTYPRELIIALNSVSEEITLSVLPENQWVLAGRMVATSKIIPYAVSRTDMNQVLACVSSSRLSVHSPVERKVILIQTTQSSIKTSTLDKTRRITEQRLQLRSATLEQEFRCKHSVEELTATLEQALSMSAELILIVGASAISDRRDVLPSAVVASGGEVQRVGVPIDPGNLLMLASIDGRLVLGLPGCARSPKHNGLDLMLDRIACQLPLDHQWLNSLCIGGLLGEMIDRPQPRVAPDHMASKNRQLAAIVLAAGSSRRFGDTNKLLHLYRDKPLVAHVVESVQGSVLETVVVVTGHQQDLVGQALAEYQVDLCYCPVHSDGMAHSLASGISQLQSCDAVLVCLGDMPHVSSLVIDKLIEASADRATESIVVPMRDDRRGNPVLVGRAFFDSLLQREGDSGARHLIDQYPERVIEVEVDDEGIFQDYDTSQSLSQLDIR